MTTGLVALHLGAAVVLLALVALILAMALPAALRGNPPPGLYHPLRRVAAALLLAQVSVGGILLLAGRRPLTNLHLIYALAAILVMPAVRLLVRRDPRRARFFQLGGTLLLLGVLFRLLTTG
ncbi:MAG: hypothetical protein M3O87_01355 [Candidatus Dormibacteraeota bacterium]|nr:hypothetical protein [Candidatus Dormibacteraeota bacterium]